MAVLFEALVSTQMREALILGFGTAAVLGLAAVGVWAMLRWL